MANPEHLEILKRGVEEWNRWRRENPGTWPDLRDTNFRITELERVGVARLYLTGIDLSGGKLSGANLRGANLLGANFLGADLFGANLSRACLRWANLSARLWQADLSGASLPGANLSLARFSNTNLHGADLSEAKGLGTVEHRAPSAVSSQTLEKSKGRIPDIFLKGCGLKDWEILAAKLHDPDLPADQVTSIGYEIINLRTHAPIVPLSVFVSYAHEDRDFASKVEGLLDKDGIRFWRDVHDMVAGPLEQQIDRAISIHGAVLLILSKHSVESDWVRWEAERARKLEQELEAEADGELRHRLCPVALDDSWKTCRWPGRLRSQIEDYNILDFSMWRTDEEAFEAQYQKLKTGLGIYYRN